MKIKEINYRYSTFLKLFLLPWIIVSILFSFIEIQPSVVNNEIIKNLFGFNTIWADFKTALLNKHRLFIGGIFIGFLTSYIESVILKKKKKVSITVFLLLSFLTAFSANILDVFWLHRLQPEKILWYAMTRSLIWVLVALLLSLDVLKEKPVSS